ncbi:GNAT family N-acetyltransferase [Cellulomonas dongxiuzhuiae]|uniref:GNAT family N-acetyltransferase n=1 Tax=Cellulomonas dongxiuzhuiae TaxID=2819979 RepID=UPI001AAEA459|nr:GNAT family N-acetyltransferase [Cellulomonas dongxiuzhuiae]MBO3089221.1 N-acetyltransferase [Cellulomonas dongxiuzhuiae]
MTEEPTGPAPVVEHDEPRRRYVLRIGPDEVGELGYSVAADRVVLEHTRVDEGRQEKGLGSQLVRYALDDVRGAGRRVVPQCPFVRAYVERNPQYADLVD